MTEKCDSNAFLHYQPYNRSEWQPISLTLVEYPKDDIIGKLLAWISLTPLAIGSGFVALIMFRRDLHTITFFVGTLINECLNQILKNWIKEPRPVSREHSYTEYGMPSSHSQFMCFFSTYVMLFVIIRLHHINNSSQERLLRLTILLTCWSISVLVCFGRIYLQYHSLMQVLIGCATGILTGTLWFCINHIFLTPMYPIIVSWRISELFLIRDTTLIPNILWFEYTTTRLESRARARKQKGQ